MPPSTRSFADRISTTPSTYSVSAEGLRVGIRELRGNTKKGTQHDLLCYSLHNFVFVQAKSIIRIQAGHRKIRLDSIFKTTISRLVFLCGDDESSHGWETVSMVSDPVTLSPSSVSAALARLSFKIARRRTRIEKTHSWSRLAARFSWVNQVSVYSVDRGACS